MIGESNKQLAVVLWHFAELQPSSDNAVFGEERAGHTACRVRRVGALGDVEERPTRTNATPQPVRPGIYISMGSRRRLPATRSLDTRDIRK